MNIVNHIRFLLVCFAMLWHVGAVAEDGPVQRDTLELDSSSITGNQELPKVLYIVPWKEAAIGNLEGRPVNSLLDEVLAPVDREEFQREVRYFGQLNDVAPGAEAAGD